MSTISGHDDHSQIQLLDEWWPISWAVSFEAYVQNPEAFRELRDRYAKNSSAAMRPQSGAYLRGLAMRIADRRSRLAPFLSTFVLALARFRPPY